MREICRRLNADELFQTASRVATDSTKWSPRRDHPPRPAARRRASRHPARPIPDDELLTAELARLDRKIEAADSEQLRRRVHDFAAHIHAVIDTLDDTQKQQLLRLLVEDIRVTGWHVQIKLRIVLDPPPPEPLFISGCGRLRISQRDNTSILVLDLAATVKGPNATSDARLDTRPGRTAVLDGVDRRPPHNFHPQQGDRQVRMARTLSKRRGLPSLSERSNRRLPTRVTHLLG